MTRVIAAAALSVLVVASAAAQSFFKNQPARLAVDARVEGTLDSKTRTAQLVLAATPVPGVHVYAPGNPDYIQVSVALSPVEGLTVGEVTFPEAEPYFFAPLRQAVKVYSKPFAVRIPLTASAALLKDRRAAGARSVPVKGAISYQACDDKVCFPPQTLTFSADVPVKK